MTGASAIFPTLEMEVEFWKTEKPQNQHLKDTIRFSMTSLWKLWEHSTMRYTFWNYTLQLYGLKSIVISGRARACACRFWNGGYIYFFLMFVPLMYKSTHSQVPDPVRSLRMWAWSQIGSGLKCPQWTPKQPDHFCIKKVRGVYVVTSTRSPIKIAHLA